MTTAAGRPFDASEAEGGVASHTSAVASRSTDAIATASRHVAWAELLRRCFGLDVLACPDCGVDTA